MDFAGGCEENSLLAAAPQEGSTLVWGAEGRLLGGQSLLGVLGLGSGWDHVCMGRKRQCGSSGSLWRHSTAGDDTRWGQRAGMSLPVLVCRAGWRSRLEDRFIMEKEKRCLQSEFLLCTVWCGSSKA